MELDISTGCSTIAKAFSAISHVNMACVKRIYECRFCQVSRAVQPTLSIRLIAVILVQSFCAASSKNEGTIAVSVRVKRSSEEIEGHLLPIVPQANNLPVFGSAHKIIGTKLFEIGP
jgi:hypothetical protein